MSDKYQIVQMISAPDALKSKDYIPLTVGSLKAWLEQFPDNVKINLMSKVIGQREDNCIVPVAAMYKNKTELLEVFVLTKREEMDDEGNI